MTRKRDAFERPGDSVSPRKRHQKEQGEDYLVHLKYSDDVRVHNIVDFINRTVQKEWKFSVGHRDGAIVNHRADSEEGWILEAVSSDLAKKVCNLNGMYYKHQPLKIQKYGALTSPSKFCWNEYHYKRYGKNDHFVEHNILATILNSEAGGTDIDALKLQTMLNEKMEEFKLASTNTPIVKSIKIDSEDGNGKFLLSMRTERYASRLTYLNHINIGNHSIALTRLPEWKGEKPRYLNYDEFRKDHQHNELGSKPAAVEKAQAVTIVIEESKELEVAIAAQGSMKAIIAKQAANAKDLRSSLKIANDKLVQKDERIAQLEKVMEEQTQLLEDKCESMKTIIAKQTADAKKASNSLKLAKEKSAQKDERIAQLQTIVKKQKKDLEDERDKVSSKEEEVGILRQNLAFQKDEIEEQCRIVTSKEEETAKLNGNVERLSDELDSTVVKLDAVHQSWSDQVLMLEAKDKQIAIMNAKFEKLRGAFLWQPGMDAKEKAELQELKGGIYRD
ncbi:unnamed protein product [Cylindrotheca closterium]|uniref:Uncharacterized protein n=1 Tax=Cylindrotheca closterium TaxID=2856 RepID=A0AAD2G501_9STRA|nr:unnamed protein product [Cylindrotheca closterium]